MSVIEKKYKFEDDGFSCTKIKEIIPYEKFISISKFKKEYTISYHTQKGNIKKIKIEVSENLHESVDEFLNNKFPQIEITQKKAGVLRCISDFLGIPLCYICLLLACLISKSSDVDMGNIPVIIYPIFKFVLNSSYAKNLAVMCGLALLSILLGLLSYKKDNIIYQYHLNNVENPS